MLMNKDNEQLNTLNDDSHVLDLVHGAIIKQWHILCYEFLRHLKGNRIKFTKLRRYYTFYLIMLIGSILILTFRNVRTCTIVKLMKFLNPKIKKGGKISADRFALFLCFTTHVEVTWSLLFLKFINFHSAESMP